MHKNKCRDHFKIMLYMYVEYIEVVNVLNTAQSQVLLFVFDDGCITYLFSLSFFLPESGLI